MKLVETYLTCGSIAETARRWRTSPNLVRKRVRRFEKMDFLGFRTNPAAAFLPFPNPRENRSQGPGSARIPGLWKGKGFPGYLWQEEGLVLLPSHDPDTSLRGNGYTNRRKRRKAFYPAH